jgi:hypothetical protein
MTLGAKFRSGAVCYYYWIPMEMHEALMGLPDTAAYFGKHIKGSYEHQLVEEPRTVAERAPRKRKAAT